ncbi:adaptin ear-binding coat-associated protein 2 [Myriangium duriaei CBS 260.36]|uniref:Adaptin ear-binding coat-associated protein 2 n=1 Tax=Myriangium duriaei CBS 260.36 TaxID=1168546 RepID=A0A9P4MIQ3_9PEZI|nr:adaptin ear-binding coat-associated protein 2 [Myriangium duriaei CBS 260.36]
MAAINPASGRPLPPHAIQRTLFSGHPVHVYAIPPLTSTRGFLAGPWTAPPRPTAQHIFTARLRVLETSLDSTLSVAVVLEDPNSAEFFAGAPYASAAAVQAATDSSRFFAIRVVGEDGRKAMLGIGFEERGDAVDFGIALAEGRKVLGLEGEGQKGRGGKKEDVQEVKRDLGLKEGESIVVEIGGKGRRVREKKEDGAEDSKALFSFAPPPGAGGGMGMPVLAPPPGTTVDAKKQAQDLGFDDGEFGEFQ